MEEKFLRGKASEETTGGQTTHNRNFHPATGIHHPPTRPTKHIATMDPNSLTPQQQQAVMVQAQNEANQQVCSIIIIGL